MTSTAMVTMTVAMMVALGLVAFTGWGGGWPAPAAPLCHRRRRQWLRCQHGGVSFTDAQCRRRRRRRRLCRRQRQVPAGSGPGYRVSLAGWPFPIFRARLVRACPCLPSCTCVRSCRACLVLSSPSVLLERLVQSLPSSSSRAEMSYRVYPQREAGVPQREAGGPQETGGAQREAVDPQREAGDPQSDVCDPRQGRRPTARGRRPTARGLRPTTRGRQPAARGRRSTASRSPLFS
eukprot:gene2305-biopygen12508